MDDVNLFRRKLEDLLTVDQTFLKYEDLSGTLLSRSKKTKVMGVCQYKEIENWPLHWLQKVDTLRLLGVHFSQDIDTTIHHTWEVVVKGVRAANQRWIKQRGWTMLGRVKIPHVFILSKVWYVAQVLPIPQSTVEKLNQAISHYLFHDQVERIALEQLFEKKEYGGLQLVNTEAKCHALIARTLSAKVKALSPHIQYWMSLPLREYVAVQGPRAETASKYFKLVIPVVKEAMEIRKSMPSVTTKQLYEQFNSTPPPSRMAERHQDVVSICRRMYKTADPEIADTFYKLASGVLPTRARLHSLNPARWDTPLCKWCGVSADLAHVFTTCQMVVPVWTWIRSVIGKIAGNLVRIKDSELLNLEFPVTKMEIEISYLVMSTIKHWWEHVRQYRILTVEKLKAIIKQDMKRRQVMRLPRLSNNLYELIVT